MSKIYKITKFSEYIDCIAAIGNKGKKNKDCPEQLWFRGLDYEGHALIPSLYRLNELTDINVGDENLYSKLRYAEDFRVQHYIAKNYHYYAKLPASRLEWLEVMQHHLAKTRVLDWSESAIHSLVFAIEPFINKDRSTLTLREKQFPCVWVLKPQKINGKIFEAILSNKCYTDIIFEDIKITKNQKRELTGIIQKSLEFIKKYTGINVESDSCRLKSMRHLEFIVNLSTINDEIRINRDRIFFLLRSKELFPVFYILNRIYAEGRIVEDRKLPPLAVVQPYHSERIKAQKGVFTVFPECREKKELCPSDSVLRSINVEPNAMQYNEIAKKCMTRIDILDPERIAYEIITCGINASWLYPELPIVANEIESRRVY